MQLSAFIGSKSDAGPYVPNIVFTYEHIYSRSDRLDYIILFYVYICISYR